MSDIPSEALNSTVSYICLRCRAVTRRARPGDCPKGPMGHVWVHPKHLDDHAAGRPVPDYAQRIFETYPDETEACFKAAAAKTRTKAPGEPS